MIENIWLEIYHKQEAANLIVTVRGNLVKLAQELKKKNRVILI